MNYHKLPFLNTGQKVYNLFDIDWKKVGKFQKYKKANWKQMKPRQRKLYYAIHNICKKDFETRAKREYIVAPYIIDVYIPKLGIAIKIDGGIHENRQEYDSRRDNYLESLGLLVLRFNNDIVDRYFDDVVETVKRAIIKRNNLSMKQYIEMHNLNYYRRNQGAYS
jgi:very-short-patch-repair endonuclease